MDSVDLQARNNETFVFLHDITNWSQLYPLDQCSFKSQMRQSADNPLVLFEWSFDTNTLTIFLKAATGILSFVANPVANNTITLGGTSIKFVASGAVGNQVNIGAAIADTLTNLLAFLDASTDAAIIACNYAVNGTDLDIEYSAAGGMGNSFAIASNSANIVASGATLSGGAAISEMRAPRQSAQIFFGSYVYDFKLIFDGQEVVIFGGALEFTDGVTL